MALDFVCWVVLILYVLHETDALPKWAQLLHLKWFKVDEYEKKREMFGEKFRYHHFLLTRSHNFFIFLFSCAECLCVWFCALGFIFLPLGGWIAFGKITLACIFGLAAFKFTLRKLYE